MLPQWYKLRTNAEILGTTQTGKSKCTEYCLREHVRAGNGFLLVDWHGTSYRAMVEYLAYIRPQKPIVLLNLSQPEYIRPFNPFALPTGREITSHVARLTDLIVRPWAGNLNEMPTYERIVKMLLTFCAVSGEPLHHGAKLLEMPKREHRELAISVIQDEYIKQQWKQFQYITRFQDWKREVESTQNRLGRFIGSKSIKLFTGLPGDLPVDDWIEQKAIVLVNLQQSDFLSEESGKVFAALLLSEILNTARRNAGKERPFFVYADEAQAYLTADAARMLDETVKSGLRITVIHHHSGQFQDEHLRMSLETNARIRLAFAGLPPAEAKRCAEEFFMGELNKRWKKDDRVQFVTEHEEEAYETTTASSGGSHSAGTVGDSESEHSGSSWNSAKVSGTRFVPHLRKEVVGQEDFTMEEKLSKLAARLMGLPTGQCYVKLASREARLWEVPFVRRYLLNPGDVLEYEKRLQSNAIPIHEAERLITEQERSFLERGKEYDGSRGRPKKKPARLCGQE